MSEMPVHAPSFAEAMELTSGWLRLWDDDQLSDEVVADRIGELVASRDGARGFFVVALTSDVPLMDRLPEALVLALRRAGDGVVDLTVRNLAMSTAMAVHHGRTGDTAQQASSERVQQRSRELLRVLEPHAVKARLETLLAATQGEGGDVAFLERWGYDTEQRREIGQAVLAVADLPTTEG